MWPWPGRMEIEVGHTRLSWHEEVTFIELEHELIMLQEHKLVLLILAGLIYSIQLQEKWRMYNSGIIGGEDEVRVEGKAAPLRNLPHLFPGSASSIKGAAQMQG